MSEIKLTSTYYLQEVISALVQEGYTLEVKRGRNEDEIIIRWASVDRKTEPTISKMEQVEDEPQIDGAIDEARFKAHCMNCQRDVADIKCLDCDGDKYFIADEPQTERSE